MFNRLKKNQYKCLFDMGRLVQSVKNKNPSVSFLTREQFLRDGYLQTDFISYLVKIAKGMTFYKKLFNIMIKAKLMLVQVVLGIREMKADLPIL